ncbi:MAG: GYD domain-containing protein [Actinomycetota bacterium]|nr:GYD domain-containing protein [Actinomycetota bacterium]
MARYIALIDWTDQGVRSFKETVDRAGQAEQLAQRLGARLVDLYWTLGEHDLVGVLEAPDDQTATAFSLSVGAQGNIRTKTLRAFTRDEMQGILEKTA